MGNIVNEIRERFLKEAFESPLLFNDLANMEKYVSESYSGRSLIELLQNADDAGARSFFLEKLDDNKFVVANDGRVFTDEDMLSLCRSGVSTKKRKSESIGYRGIGFKSVVNYAEVVSLFSGEINVSFSRKLTQESLNSDKEVPLIRIPHNTVNENYIDLANRLHASGYNTVFVFETKNNTWEQEISVFDSSCMLFLNSVCNINLMCNEEYMFSSMRVPFKDGHKVTLNTKSTENDWYVIKSDKPNCKSSVAFKLMENKVINAESSDSIAHCFMPTLNRMTIPVKINGDFSTDPSRTRITMDEETKEAVQDCMVIVGKIICKIIESNEDKLGIVQIIKQGKIDPISKIRGEDINDLFCRLLDEYIQDYLVQKSNGKSIYLQPNGMTDEDFQAILDYHSAYGIFNEQEKMIPGLFDLLLLHKIPYLPANLSVNAMKTIECSDTTKATVVGNLIQENKFGLSNELKEEIKEAKLFKFDSGADKINDTSEDATIDSAFEGSVLENISSPQEYTSFVKRLGIKSSKETIVDNNEHKFESTKGLEIVPTEVVKKEKVIKKWRTVEKNVAEVLELSENVSNVKDVSKQNLGYDLEATMKDGTKRFYEVKSVNGFNDTFSITNNEYTTANTNKENYYLAITSMAEDTMDVCFIKNPIDQLKFVKRITRWEWLCEEYSGETIKVNMKE